MKKLLDQLLKEKERRGFMAQQMPPPFPPDPSDKDVEKLKQALQDEVNAHEDEQVKVFLEYPEEIRELFLQAKRQHLLQEMHERIGSIYRSEPPILEQMRKKFNPNTIAKIEQEFRFRYRTTSLVDIYKRLQSAHCDKVANHILLDDKDEK